MEGHVPLPLPLLPDGETAVGYSKDAASSSSAALSPLQGSNCLKDQVVVAVLRPVVITTTTRHTPDGTELSLNPPHCTSLCSRGDFEPAIEAAAC
jgi:hypothetical protein